MSSLADTKDGACPILLTSMANDAMQVGECGHNFSFEGLRQFFNALNPPLDIESQTLKTQLANRIVSCPLCRGKITSIAPDFHLRHQIRAAEKARAEQLPQLQQEEKAPPIPEVRIDIPPSSPSAVAAPVAEQVAPPPPIVRSHYSEDFPDPLCDCCNCCSAISSVGLARAWEEEEAACENGCRPACWPAMKLRAKHLVGAAIGMPVSCAISIAACLGGASGILCGCLCLPAAADTRDGFGVIGACCLCGGYSCYLGLIYAVDCLWQLVRLACNPCCPEAISPKQYMWDAKLANQMRPWES